MRDDHTAHARMIHHSWLILISPLLISSHLISSLLISSDPMLSSLFDLRGRIRVFDSHLQEEERISQLHPLA